MNDLPALIVRHPALTNAHHLPVAHLVEVDTDREAIRVWLKSVSRRSHHTHRAYAREAERLLMWLEVAKGPAPDHLPRVGVDDMNQYLDYCQAPLPFPKSLLERFDRKQQPFRGPLAGDSQRQMIVILHGMFEALRNLRGPAGLPYVLMNPVALIRSGITREEEDIEEALTQEELAAVFAAVEDLPRKTEKDLGHYHRARWLMNLLYRAWLRRDEAANLIMGAFELKKDGWTIRFQGKGGKTARIVAPPKLMAELEIYRAHLGLAPLPSPGETRPAILPASGREAHITDQTVYLICKTIFEKAAAMIEVENVVGAAHLRQASPHWMRHTGISHAMEAGVDPRYVQAQARHSSLTVTARYDHKERQEWQRQMERV